MRYMDTQTAKHAAKEKKANITVGMASNSLLSTMVIKQFSKVYKSPSRMAEVKEEELSLKEHILRNHGQDVSTMKNGSHVTKGVNLPSAMQREDWSKYDEYTGYTSAANDKAIQINFRMKYKLNTIKFLLWDIDDREYDYKISVSADGKVWKELCKLSNRKSWQEIIFNCKSMKHVRIVGIGCSMRIVKFMCYFDYSR